MSEEKNKKQVKNDKYGIFGMNCGKENRKMLGDIQENESEKSSLEKNFSKVDLYLKELKNEVITEEKIQYILDKIKSESKSKFKSEIINKKIIKEWIWSSGNKVAVSSYKDYEKKLNKEFIPVLNLKFKSMDSNLMVLNKANIYDFLRLEKLLLNFWNKEEVEKKRELLKKNNAENDAKRKLYSFCAELVKQNEIEEYNEYLEKMECVKIKKELKIIEEAKQKFGEEITEKKIESFVNKFKDVVEEKIAREIFSKYFENDLKNNFKKNLENSEKLNVIKLKRQSLIFMMTGIVCLLITVFMWVQADGRKVNKSYSKEKEIDRENEKKQYEKTSQEENLDKKNDIEISNKKEVEKISQEVNTSTANNLSPTSEEKGNNEKVKVEEKTKKMIQENGNNENARRNLEETIKQDDEKAKKFYEEAAQDGNAEALRNLGDLYREEGNKEKAKELYEKSAGKGNAEALRNLGDLYREEGNNE